MRNLLTTSNPKVVKSLKLGYLAAVLCLTPGTFVLRGRKLVLCAYAKLAGCLTGCLVFAGRSGIEMPDGTENPIRVAQRARTELLCSDPDDFFDRLHNEISNLEKRAKRQKLLPACRLNGLSDLDWEVIHPSLFTEHPDVQFYDYTKDADRYSRWENGDRFPNYYLTFSWYLARDRFCHDLLKRKGNVTIVSMRSFEDAYGDAKRPMYRGFPVINGDAHDARWTDKRGSWVWLKAKGKARKNFNPKFMIE